MTIGWAGVNSSDSSVTNPVALCNSSDSFVANPVALYYVMLTALSFSNDVSIVGRSKFKVAQVDGLPTKRATKRETIAIIIKFGGMSPNRLRPNCDRNPGIRRPL